MNYHTPVKQDISNEANNFMIRGNELVVPQKVYKKEQYPNLPCDMVKIVGMDGRNVFLPAHKFGRIAI